MGFMNTTSKNKILLVEDDPVLGEGLVLSLTLEGYEVTWAKNFKDGLENFSVKSFHLVVLDIGLPDGLGTNLCREIRSQNREVPIIFLTAKSDEETVVHGLELGANDFVKKPFSHKELMARIRVYFRERYVPATDIKINELMIRPDNRQVFHKDQELGLNRRQFDILSYFATRPDQIITREQLISHLDQGAAIFDRTVDSHLSQLRKILKTHQVNCIQIVPVYGVGYRLEVHK